MSENENASLEAIFGPAIYRYTRAEAIADGVLIDVSPMAKEAGLRWPVALTTAAWENCVCWTEGDSERQTYQDLSGRLWDVLVMAYHAIRAAPAGNDWLTFVVHRVPRDGRSVGAVPTRLKLVVGPGDQGEPVFTVLMPGED